MPADSTREKIFAITPPAREKVLRVRADQPDAERLALRVEVTGVSRGEYDSTASFQHLDEVGPADVVERHEGLVLICPADQVEALSGATIDLEGNQIVGSLIIVNPNRPTAADVSPAVAAAAGPAPDLGGEVAQRIQRVLAEQINPGIASHGGYAELVAVEDVTAYLRLSGGCQGCAMAPVTLTQGIEVAITSVAPEITRVVDVTDHANGTNPYYEESKK
ncbi:MAG: NifU family protein [Gaiellales bacterium]